MFGSPYGATLKGDLIPTEIIVKAVNDGVTEVAEGLGLVPMYQTFTAGPAGVQEGKIVYWDGTYVHHASADIADHQGKIVGITATASGPGYPAKIQQYGVLESTQLVFGSFITPLLCGINGVPARTVQNNTKFIQLIGMSIGPNKMIVDLDPFSITV